MPELPNPLIPGFNPDPSAVRVGDRWYLVTSTFEYLPGIPVYASDDMITWEHVSDVITRQSQGELEEVPTAGGVWAPTIRYRDGRFYVIVTIAMGRGCVVFSAERAEGPWDDGVLIEGIEGIDPDLVWDADGTAVVTYSGLVVKGENFGHHGGIRQVDVDLATGALLSPIRDLWSGTGGMFPEAPHLHERDGFWYLIIAEGGTERGHGVSVARSRSPRGPFENGPANPIVSARSTTRPVQNTGHGDLVEGPDGSTVMVLLGVRPRGMTRAFSALGRETFVTDVHWVDGWPQADPVELRPAPVPSPERIDLGAALGAGWLAVRREPADLIDQESVPGALTLHGEGRDLASARPVFLGRRQTHQTAAYTVTVDIGTSDAAAGGLAVRYDEATFYGLTVRRSAAGVEVTAEARIPGLTQTWSTEFPTGPIDLTLASVPPSQPMSATSDLVRLSAAQGDREVLLAEVDGRSLSAETAASFTGRVVGLFAIDGDVAFTDWRVTVSDE